MLSITEEARHLAKYTKKCDERAAITSTRNKELESLRYRTGEEAGMAAIDSDDEMEITGSRKNSKAAKTNAIARILTKRKKKVVAPSVHDTEPLEVHDSDSDTPQSAHRVRGTSSHALVVDSPSPKKKRAPKKNAASRIKSNPYVLDEVDDDEPQGRAGKDIVVEDENSYAGSFIDDGSSDMHATSPKRKQSKSGGKSKDKEKEKTRPKASTTTTKRKKQPRSDEFVGVDDSDRLGYPPIMDDEQDDDFVPDSADEAAAAPRPTSRSSARKGKQKQQQQAQGEEESVVPIIPMDVGYSDGPDDEGEQTETEGPGPSKPKPRNARLAAIADEEGNNTAATNDDEYNLTDDDLVDLTEEDPFDMGVIDVDLYDDAPSQRFRDFEADFGEVKHESGMPGGGNDGDIDAAADEFDDIAFDQNFMDNLDGFDYHDLGDDANGNAPPVAAQVTTYTRAAVGDYDDVESEDDDDTERFIPISELSEADRDFFLNHWRRSATEATGLMGSEKQLAEGRQAKSAATSRGRGRGGRGGGGKWRGGRASWRGKR